MNKIVPAEVMDGIVTVYSGGEEPPVAMLHVERNPDDPMADNEVMFFSRKPAISVSINDGLPSLYPLDEIECIGIHRFSIRAYIPSNGGYIMPKALRFNKVAVPIEGFSFVAHHGNGEYEMNIQVGLVPFNRADSRE